MKKIVHSLFSRNHFEMGKSKARKYWEHYYKPGQDMYWFQVPKTGSIKFTYDNIVNNNWGRHWNMPSHPPKRVEKDKPIEEDPLVLEDVKIGSIILFATPKKLIDLFLIIDIKDDRIYLSPVFFTMLWKNVKIIAPIPACYQYPQRSHPVKLEGCDNFRDYIEKHGNDILEIIYNNNKKRN